MIPCNSNFVNFLFCYSHIWKEELRKSKRSHVEHQGCLLFIDHWSLIYLQTWCRGWLHEFKKTQSSLLSDLLLSLCDFKHKISTRLSRVTFDLIFFLYPLPSSLAWVCQLCLLDASVAFSPPHSHPHLNSFTWIILTRVPASSCCLLQFSIYFSIEAGCQKHGY